MIKTTRMLCIALMFVCFTTEAAVAEESKTSDIPQIPTPGLVTMLDLGAHTCIPCKMMAPIIAELQKEYAGRASVIFIDVWQNREQAQRYGIRAIPTQIFFNQEGEESGRHVGFLDKENIEAIFKKLGVPQKGER